MEAVAEVRGVEDLTRRRREHIVSVMPPTTGRETLLDLAPTVLA